MSSPPPQFVAAAVERYAPGFWGAWSRAMQSAYSEAGGWTVNSWWRDPQHNAAVGGVPGSQHMLGTGVDLASRDLTRLDAALRRQGFQTIRYSTHIHAQAWPAGVAAPVLRSLGYA